MPQPLRAQRLSSSSIDGSACFTEAIDSLVQATYDPQDSVPNSKQLIRKGKPSMLIGTHDATLHQVQRVDLHGTHFYDLIFEHLTAPGQLRRARVGAESIYAEPQPGDAIRVSYLMSVVASVERRTNE